MKSNANRCILSADIKLSSAEDFFNFTKKFNDDAAKLNNTNEPPINVYYLKSATIEHVTETILTDRFKNLKGNNHIFLIDGSTKFSIRPNQKYSDVSSVRSKGSVYHSM